MVVEMLGQTGSNECLKALGNNLAFIMLNGRTKNE